MTVGQWIIDIVSIVTCSLLVLFTTPKVLGEFFPAPPFPPLPPPLPNEPPVMISRHVVSPLWIQLSALGSAMVAGWVVACAMPTYGFCIFPLCTAFWGFVGADYMQGWLRKRLSDFKWASLHSPVAGPAPGLAAWYQRILPVGTTVGFLLGVVFFALTR